MSTVQASEPDPDTRAAAVFDAVIDAPFGRLGIRLAQGRLTAIDFLPAEVPLKAPDSEPARQAGQRLQAYLCGQCADLDLPLRLHGTTFQQRVWEALRQIPAGQTLTYGELARGLGSSARAVGGACRRNPLPLVVPCHRVVARGGLGGFAGHRQGGPTRIKAWLLGHESRAFAP